MFCSCGYLLAATHNEGRPMMAGQRQANWRWLDSSAKTLGPTAVFATLRRVRHGVRETHQRRSSGRGREPPATDLVSVPGCLAALN